MDDLIKFGEVQRGTIPGITLQPLTTQIAEQLGAPNTHGAVVVGVQQRSDAYAAGIRPGDIISQLQRDTDRRRVAFRAAAVATRRSASTVTLGVLRERTTARGQGPDRQGNASPPPRVVLARRRRRPSASGPDTASLSVAMHAPRRLHPDPDPDARLQATAAARQPAILDPQRAVGQVEAVLPRARCPARASGCPGRGTVPSRQTPRAGGRSRARAAGASAAPLRAVRARGSAPRPASLPLRSRHSPGSGSRNSGRRRRTRAARRAARCGVVGPGAAWQAGSDSPM